MGDVKDVCPACAAGNHGVECFVDFCECNCNETLPAPAPRLLVKLLPHAVGLPAYQTPGAAGLDLCAAFEYSMMGPPVDVIAGDGIREWGRNSEGVPYFWIPPGEVVSIPTGIALAIPPGWQGEVRGRSGLLFRHGVHVPQTGTIDSDYRGEVRVALHNAGSEPFVVRRGDRIAQLVLTPAPRFAIDQVESLPETARGDAGFGSTGVR